MDARDTSDQIGEEAVAWYVENLDTDGAAYRRHAFLAWLKRSPRHVQAYLEVATVSRDVAALVRDMPLHAEAVAAKSGASRGNVVALADWRRTGAPSPEAGSASMRQAAADVVTVQAQTPVPGRYARALRRATALVACLAVLAVGWLAVPRTEELSTDIGEQRLLVLADATRLHLDADSRVRVRIGWLRREIELLEGRAGFVVAPDHRPFLVQADGLLIEDIGTTFDVMVQPSGTRVSVVEGRVQVWQRQARGDGAPLADLAAGEVARIMREDGRVRLTRDDAATMLDWLEGWIEFDGDRLDDVVARFNRFHHEQIRIVDAPAGRVRISGRLRHRDLGDLVEFLAREEALRVSRTGDEVVIRSR